MTTSQALKKVVPEIQALLADAGIKDGRSLPNEELSKTKDILYWYPSVKDADGSRWETYLVWSVVNVDEKTWGDDKVAMREAFIAVDIFTRKHRFEPVIVKLIDDLDSKSAAAGWKLTQSGSDVVETAQDMLHLAFQLTKDIK